MYEQEKRHVKDQLISVVPSGCFALTTDLWSSRAKHSYTGLTVHYISQDFHLLTHLLETLEFSETHMAEHITAELEAILVDWELGGSQAVAATTDNGSNIALATQLLNWPHVSCLSHTLQLAVTEAMKLPDVNRALGRCRRLVSHFNHSVKSTYKLREKQVHLHHNQLALVLEVVTRWNSSYYMVQRILQQPLCACLLDLRKGDLMPSDREFAVMESYCKAMKPLVETTEAVGAEKWITISHVRPLLHKLLTTYLIPVESDTHVEKALKRVTLNNLSDCYTGETLELLNKASFLDSCFKSLLFLSEEERRATQSSILEEAAVVNVSKLHLHTEEPQHKRSRGETKLMELLEDVMEDTGGQDQWAEKELHKYISEDPVTDKPLTW